MKSMRLPLATIFFMTYFHNAGGRGHGEEYIFEFSCNIYKAGNIAFLYCINLKIG